MTSSLFLARIKEFVGSHFYLSPAGDLWLEDAIVANVPSGYELEEGEETNILYWDVGEYNKE